MARRAAFARTLARHLTQKAAASEAIQDALRRDGDQTPLTPATRDRHHRREPGAFDDPAAFQSCLQAMDRAARRRRIARGRVVSHGVRTRSSAGRLADDRQYHASPDDYHLLNGLFGNGASSGTGHYRWRSRLVPPRLGKPNPAAQPSSRTARFSRIRRFSRFPRRLRDYDHGDRYPDPERNGTIEWTPGGFGHIFAP